METFPIMLNLAGRLAAVVGGGPVGIRKVRSLRQAGARVRLIAPRLAAEGADLTADEGVEIVSTPYRLGHIEGALLVFACTDDRALNARVAADARAAGALVNAADQPEDCDFFLPAAVRDGPVVVAVGTGGAAPGLAAALKDRLAAALPERVGEFAALLGELRQELRKAVNDPRARGGIMKVLADEATYRLFLQAGPEAVRGRFRELIGG